MLRDLAAEASRTGRHIYPLALHVDYWNDLGWPDPYSSGLATTRQRAYARALGQEGVYTPEMVINGREAFVGSNRSRARRGIDAALSGPEGIRISLHAKPVDRQLAVDFTLSAAPPKGTVLQLALVQVEAVTRVAAGENGGRTLRHANVVRSFQSVELDGAPSGRATLAAPLVHGVTKEAVLAFLQDPVSMAVGGAARVDLSPARTE